MMLPTILKYRLRQTYNTLTRSSRQKKLGWLISIGFIVPYYAMAMKAMEMMYNGLYGEHGWQAVVRLASIQLAMAFFFVLVSTAALTSYRMFQAKDLSLLISLPTRSGSLFLARLFETLADTCRGMILPFPICIAFARVISKAISPFAAAAFIIGWILILLQLACLSVIIALILGRIIAAGRWLGLLRIVAVVAAMVFLMVFMGHVLQDAMPLGRLARFSAFFPTSWLIGILPYEGSAIWLCFLYGAGFISMTIICLAAAFWFFRRRFHRFWMLSMETKRRGTQKFITRRASRSTHAMGSTRILILKEARVVFREPHTWIGLLIPLVMFPIFVFLRGDEQGSQLVFIIIVSLLSSASYSLSCVGREGRSFPLLRSMPIRMSVLLRAKLCLGWAINFAVTLVFVFALYIFQLSQLSQMWRNMLVACIVSTYFPIFGTALAGLFPKFDFTNPMRAASLPGLLVLYLIALLFGATFIGIGSIRWYLVPPLALVPWAGVALILMKISRDRLEKMDV